MKFSTILLDQTLKKKRYEQEELRKQTLKKLDKILHEMSKIIPFKGAYIFGSITKPYQFTRESDVDIAFLGLDDCDFFRAMSILSIKLKRDVDIVQLEHHRIKDKIIRDGIKWKKSYL